MYRIGIDVGSTYTKYCVFNEEGKFSLFMEKTPIHQNDYFEAKLRDLVKAYGEAEIVSCGYGKNNVQGMSSRNELTALARGSFYLTGNNGVLLDIGGQDTKVIYQEQGRLTEFFVNDKCAAGSGMFLMNVLDMIGASFEDIDLSGCTGKHIELSYDCAVFAQSKIVELIVDNHTENEILYAVISQILLKSKPLLQKIGAESFMLSGGLSQINGIEDLAARILGLNCNKVENGTFLSAIGCVV